MSNLTVRLRGLFATLALVAVVAGVPILLLAIDAVPDPGAFSWSRLTARDDGTVAMEVITLVCWIAWAVFTCQLIASIVSQIRGLRAPRWPGLTVPQLAADRLVAAAALLFIAVPAAAAVMPQQRAHAAVAVPLLEAPVTAHDAVEPPAPQAPVAEENGPATEHYTVKRGDSLWKIAEDRLGDGTRYVELVELNAAVLDGQPSFLLPGTVLKVPVSEPMPADEYVVQPGDTLSKIAEDQLGDADAYPSIFAASLDTVQANGTHLSDPDLILPGWTLTIPGQPDPREATRPKHAEEPTKPEVSPSRQTAPAEPRVDEPQVAEQDPQQTDAVDENRVVPGWLLPGLAGSGAVFGACLWVALRQKRRTQLRFRRPGTIIAPPPTELVAAEKTAHASASAVAVNVEALDSALRHLAPTTRVLTAELSERSITLQLAEPAELASPWTGSDRRWRVAVDRVPPRPEDSFPPYPLLVSVGRNDSGNFAFLNLEELRAVTVSGDGDRATSFARHLAAELAVNPWSAVTTVDVLGLGADLSAFNLGRVRSHPAGDTDFIAQLAREIPKIASSPDPDDFHAVIIATGEVPGQDLADLRAAITSPSSRATATLIDLSPTPPNGGTAIDVSSAGRLRAPSLDIDVTAAGLSADEAHACALLLDLTLDTTAVPVPADPANPVRDLGGALTSDLVEPRTSGPAGDTSVLPLAAQVYADVAATTVDDVETLAPTAAPQARQVAEDGDPTLDQDLARWEAPTVSTAKLFLLGPVHARTVGDSTTTAHRRPFYVELLAYLMLRPSGATAAELADTFGLRTERVRVDMSAVRGWLGTDPRTGDAFLPHAESTAPDEPARYRLHGVLCDLDLFRRLRTRGQSRGTDGISDLIAALRLVSGEPFTDLRKDHWNWLLDGDRWDHIMTSAVVDVGHIVTTHALAEGDADLAVWAASIAYAASPYDEVAQLDMVAAEEAAGDSEQAAEDLTAKILDRRDDDLPPIAVPDRTERIIRSKSWHGEPNRRTG